MIQLKFTAIAKDDLKSIRDFIAEDNISAASRFIDKIEEKCRLLASNPELGRARPELLCSLRSFPVGNYNIFYRIKKDTIEIIRVLNAARDIDTLL